jgi:hypothetical protein
MAMTSEYGAPAPPLCSACRAHSAVPCHAIALAACCPATGFMREGRCACTAHTAFPVTPCQSRLLSCCLHCTAEAKLANFINRLVFLYTACNIDSVAPAGESGLSSTALLGLSAPCPACRVLSQQPSMMSARTLSCAEPASRKTALPPPPPPLTALHGATPETAACSCVPFMSRFFNRKVRLVLCL